jgi:hypothetical protein
VKVDVDIAREFVVDREKLSALMAERDLYLDALHRVAWRLHLVIGNRFDEDDIKTILEHLDAKLPFGPPE